jgi:hypothetical protein
MPIDGRSPRLAILIDADNASARHARPIFDEVMQPLAIVPQQQFNYTTGKNAADITLVIDAMDLMHRGGLDGFCLISSDSDFTRLAQRLRENGAVVYGIGAKKTPEAFRNACTRFIYIENLLDPVKKTGKTAAARATATKDPLLKTVPLIRKAMDQTSDDDDWVNLSVVGKNLNHLAPDFDPRSFGCSKLVDVVEKTGKFEIDRPKQGGVRIKLR